MSESVIGVHVSVWIYSSIIIIITIVGSVYNITKNDAEWTSTAFIIYNGDIHEFDILAINHNSHFRIFLPVLSNECIWVSRFYCCLPIYKILLISTLDHHRLRTRRQCTDRSLVRCLCYYISVVYIGCLSTSLFVEYSLTDLSTCRQSNNRLLFTKIELSRHLEGISSFESSSPYFFYFQRSDPFRIWCRRPSHKTYHNI